MGTTNQENGGCESITPEGRQGLKQALSAHGGSGFDGEFTDVEKQKLDELVEKGGRSQLCNSDITGTFGNLACVVKGVVDAVSGFFTPNDPEQNETVCPPGATPGEAGCSQAPRVR